MKSERAEQEFEGKLVPFFAFFSSLWVFFLCFVLFSSIWEAEDAKKKHLKQKGRSGRVKAGAKSERAERELEGKFSPFFAFLFFSIVFSFFVLFCFFLVEKKKMSGESVWNRRVEVGTKSERAEQELEGKLFPFCWFFFFVVFLCVLSSLCLRKRWWQQCAVVFFYGVVAEKKKMMAMCHHFLLWCCCSEGHRLLI